MWNKGMQVSDSATRRILKNSDRFNGDAEKIDMTDWRQMDHAHARLWAAGEEQDPPNALRVQIVVQGIDGHLTACPKCKGTWLKSDGINGVYCAGCNEPLDLGKTNA